MSLPDEVLLCEVGPRDGFQYEERSIPTERKLDVIRRLVAAGVRRLQVASFVHPDWVPQMADAEAVVDGLGPAPDGVVYAGLALNLRGVDRAAATGLTCIDLSVATHDRHSMDNANMTVDEALREARRMIDRAREHGMRVQMGLQTVFGFREPGDTTLPRVRSLCEMIAAWGVDELSLADSTGMANPVQIEAYLGAIMQSVGDLPIVLHLHDTRGLGLANAVSAIRTGVTRFDTSLGGMGGCPFIRGATGNIATEDTAYLFGQMGVRTGIDVAAVAACTRQLEDFLQHRLPGKMHRILASA